jgi:hypothetical protein
MTPQKADRSHLILYTSLHTKVIDGLSTVETIVVIVNDHESADRELVVQIG